MKIDDEGFLKAMMQAYLATPVSVEVTTTFPDGRTQKVTTSVGQPVDIRGERPKPDVQLPGALCDGSGRGTQACPRR